MNSVDISPGASEEVTVTEPSLRVLFVGHTYVVGVNQGKLNAIAATDIAEVGLIAPVKWKALEWNRTIALDNPYPRIKLYPARILFGGRVGAYFYLPWAILHALLNFRPDLLQVEQEIFPFQLLKWRSGLDSQVSRWWSSFGKTWIDACRFSASGSANL